MPAKTRPLSFKPPTTGQANVVGKDLIAEQQRPEEHLAKAASFLREMHGAQQGTLTAPFQIKPKI